MGLKSLCLLAMSDFSGVAVVEVITVADRSLSRGTRMSESGRIRAIVVVTVVGAGKWGDMWVEAGVMKGGVGDMFKAAVLVAGSVSLGSAAAWYGDIPLSPGDVLYLDVRSSEVNVVRMTAFIEKEVL